MYTQLNQYHVILESEPQFQQDPNKLNKLYIQANAASGTSGAPAKFVRKRLHFRRLERVDYVRRFLTASANTMAAPPNALTSSTATSGSGRGATSAGTTSSTTSSAVPLGAFSHFETKSESLSINHQVPVPGNHRFLQPGSESRSWQCHYRDRKSAERPAFSCQPTSRFFKATAASFRNSLSNMPLLILAALVTVYIVLGVLYESFIHPITILSTLPSAGVGAFLALILFGLGPQRSCHHRPGAADWHRQKNGIMMVDFALDAERRHGKSATDAIYEACLLRSDQS